MTVRVASDGTIELMEDCPAEDADRLLAQLLRHPTAAVNWASCRSAHTAVIQVLFAARHNLTGSPTGDFLKTMIEPAFRRARR